MTSYIEQLNEFEEKIHSIVPEIIGDWHDGWDGAAGAEMRDAIYEPYPHRWDYSLRWCRIRFAAYYKMYDEMFTDERPVEKIPNWIIRRAIGVYK